MRTPNPGYPRIGSHRELKRASEQFWADKTTRPKLQETARAIRQANWLTQHQAGILPVKGMVRVVRTR